MRLEEDLQAKGYFGYFDKTDTTLPLLCLGKCKCIEMKETETTWLKAPRRRTERARERCCKQKWLSQRENYLACYLHLS